MREPNNPVSDYQSAFRPETNALTGERTLVADASKGDRAHTRGSQDSSEQRADSVMTPDLVLAPVQMFAPGDNQPTQQLKVMMGRVEGVTNQDDF